MAEKFIRDYKLTFLIPGQPALEISSINTEHPLQIEFSVEYGNGIATPTLKMKVYNLSNTSKNAINKENVQIVLEVGHRDPSKGKEAELSQIFSGFLSSQLVTVVSKADHVTTFEAEDGAFLNYIHIRDHVPGPTTLTNLLEILLKEISQESAGFLTFESPIAQGIKTDRKFPRGYTFNGVALNELNKLLSKDKLGFTTDQGVIKIWRAGEKKNKNNQETVKKIKPSTGRLTFSQPIVNEISKVPGDNQVTQGHKFRMIMDPFIRPGDNIILESLISGNIKNEDEEQVHKIKFSGTYYGNNWFSDIETRLIQLEKDEIQDATALWLFNRLNT